MFGVRSFLYGYSVKAPATSWLLWRNPRVRRWFFQGMVLFIFGYLGWFLFSNLQTNLEQRGIATGFSFLNDPAGFDIIVHLIDYSSESTYARAFFVGLLNTLLVAVCSIAFATVIGLVVGIARLSSNGLVARLAFTYVETLRNIPLLLQIFFWYFAVLRTLPGPRNSLEWNGIFFLNNRGGYFPAPVFETGMEWVSWFAVAGVIAVFFLVRWARRRQILTGKAFPVWRISWLLIVSFPLVGFFVAGTPISWEISSLQGFNFKGGVVVIPEFIALLLALSLYTASYIAEIIRSGVESVSKGQKEAACSLGLSEGQALRHVVLPQALRVIIPPLTGQYLNVVKNTSLAAAIAYPELVSVFAGTTLNQTGQAVEAIAMTMSVYLSISLIISVLMNYYNHKMRLVER